MKKKAKKRDRTITEFPTNEFLFRELMTSLAFGLGMMISGIARLCGLNCSPSSYINYISKVEDALNQYPHE